MTTLENKVVLVTGAAGGFGQAMIRQFLQAGSHLILADLRRESVEVAVAEALRLAPQAVGTVLGSVEGDLSDPDSIETLYAESGRLASHVDILVNNAGLAVSGNFADVPRERWERLMAVNLLAPMRLTARFLPDMLARRSGHIANVSSVAGLVATPRLATYSTTKFGLRAFGEALAAEVGPQGIKVTTIYPFFARTPILDSDQFGSGRRVTLPDRILYDPDFVVAELLKGIRHDRRHVYPGAVPKVLHALQRLAPWVLPLLNRTMLPS